MAISTRVSPEAERLACFYSPGCWGDLTQPDECPIQGFPDVADVVTAEPHTLLRWYLYLRQPETHLEEVIFEDIIMRLIALDDKFTIRQNNADVPIV